MTTFETAHHSVDEQSSLHSDNHNPKADDDRKLFVGKIFESNAFLLFVRGESKMHCHAQFVCFFSYVGGLTWDTTNDDLREYFSNFGTIAECSIKHDPATGRSRGFAFLVFDRKEIVEKILSQNEHFVKGRKVDPKPAHRRLAQTNSHPYLSSSSTHSLSNNNQNNHNQTNNNRKVFIGGVDPNFSDVQLREYFSRFGIIDGKIEKRHMIYTVTYMFIFVVSFSFRSVQKLIYHLIKKKTNVVHSVLFPFKTNNLLKMFSEYRNIPLAM